MLRGLVELRLEQPWLRVDFDQPHETVGWTLLGGGCHQTRRVLWRELHDRDLGPNVDARAWLRARLSTDDHDACVFLTSRSIATFEHQKIQHDGHGVDIVCTLGLSNGMDLTRPVGPRAVPTGHGTINILCRVDNVCSLAARLELLSLVVEARTTALIDATGRDPAQRITGTGTDCVIVASRCGEGPEAAYAGKHTRLGRTVIEAVYHTCRKAADSWLLDDAARRHGG